MSLLVVVAHPDDEILGAGATMNTLSERGEDVSVAILCGKAGARAFRPTTEQLENDTDASLEYIGANRVLKGDFPNIMFNTVPHLELTKFIERAIIESGADTVITHHPADTNNDHLHTSLACQAAIRYFQRQPDVTPIKDFLFMEVLSATDWSVNSAMDRFMPNTFVEVGKDAVERKIEALSMYRGVMRAYPHPRSPEALMGLAAYRGGQSGCVYAEAFQSAFRRIALAGGSRDDD